MLPGIPATCISPDRLMRNTVSRAWYIIRSAAPARPDASRHGRLLKRTHAYDHHTRRAPPAPHGQVDRTSRSPTPHTDGKPLNTP